ncbi:hypothetical protein CRM22_002230 [Opisthorchis felineus]|uniref:NADH dehydrogenase [ubiquinone] 1 alpha subcomplex subunit 2 n=1 Tax=Opisthorchis felineus TaxID=147828 RepID=A0A4S2M768_OPIFE|nr:hypothetical protein CRM22_002230 [Opisthorchis felineus]
MASVVKFGPKVKELRLLLSQTAASSRGAREFLSKYYEGVKNANPGLKILIREAKHISPKCYARYGSFFPAVISISLFFM